MSRIEITYTSEVFEREIEQYEAYGFTSRSAFVVAAFLAGSQVFRTMWNMSMDGRLFQTEEWERILGQPLDEKKPVSHQPDSEEAPLDFSFTETRWKQVE